MRINIRFIYKLGVGERSAVASRIQKALQLRQTGEPPLPTRLGIQHTCLRTAAQIRSGNKYLVSSSQPAHLTEHTAYGLPHLYRGEKLIGTQIGSSHGGCCCRWLIRKQIEKVQ